MRTVALALVASLLLASAPAGAPTAVGLDAPPDQGPEASHVPGSDRDLVTGSDRAVVPGTTSAVERPTSADGVDSGGPTAAAFDAEDPVIVERVTVDRTPNRSGSVRVDVTYDLPSGVVDFSAETAYLELDAVTLASSPGFDRQRDDSFEWDGDTTNPTLSFRISAPSRFSSSEFTVETEDWAFVSVPSVYVSWRYRGAAPTFRSVGETANGGVASRASGLDGVANTSTRTVRGVNFTLVSSPDATPGATTDEYAALYAVGLRELVGVEREALRTFVVTTDGVDTDSLAAGAAQGNTFWVQSRYSGIDDVSNTPAHELVHTRMGSFGDGDSRWLTEASAEYYGYLLALNTAHGTWSEFRDALRVRDSRYREATLAEPSTWTDESFQRTPYEKGALVLAALDAEIRNRTGGVRTLQDVFAYRFDDDDAHGHLETYENFSAAVVAVTNDPSMRDWLDRHVAGSAAPSVPSDPDAFVLNASMDSDDDGVTNGDEIRTNPFQADTDRDGFDDGEDAYPTDDTRYEQTTTHPTTTASTTTAAGPTAVASTTSAPSTTASGSDDGDADTGDAGTEAAGSTTGDRTTSTTTGQDGGDGGDGDDGGGGDRNGDGGAVPTPGDDVPGFGLAVAVLALAATTVVLRRRH